MVDLVSGSRSSTLAVSTFDHVMVPRDVIFSITSGFAIDGNTAREVSLAIHGEIYVAGGSGVRLGQVSGIGEHRIQVGQSGIVHSADFTAFVMGSGSNNHLQNFGEIYGARGIGVFQSNNMTVENHAMVAGHSDEGVLYNISGGFGRLWNSGTITGPNAVFVQAGMISIDNSGALYGSTGPAILVDVSSPDSVVLTNTGLISGSSYSVRFRDAQDFVINSGMMNGSVLLGGGDDRYFGKDDGVVIGQIVGGAGDDTLWGGDRADHIEGEADNDDLRGGSGHDTLDGGYGNDTLRGNDGNDLLIGIDPTTPSGPEIVISDDLIYGGTGNDTALGGLGRDTILGQGGSDELIGGAGSDSLSGGNGEDYLDGASGFDTLMGGLSHDTLMGGGGADILRGQGGNDLLDGGEASDQLFGGGFDDTLLGQSGFDLLHGGRGEDSLDGGAGNDTLDGGRGDDDLTGGLGADIFVFGWTNGDDVISDFQNGFDRIDLSLLDVTMPDVIAAVSAVGASAVMLDLNALGAQGTVLIDGVPLAGIGGADFIL